MPKRETVSVDCQKKWAFRERDCIIALKNGWSIASIARAYSVPERIVVHYRVVNNIPIVPSAGYGRTTPDVGQDLSIPPSNTYKTASGNIRVRTSDDIRRTVFEMASRGASQKEIVYETKISQPMVSKILRGNNKGAV